MKQFNLKKIYPILLGFFALCWFLIRVIPKPSRATYPCQQAAFPIASAFVIWITSLFASALFIVKFQRKLKEHKFAYAAFFMVLFGISFLLYSAIAPTNFLFAGKSTEYNKEIWNGSDRVENLKSNVVNTYDEVAIVKSSLTNASDIEYEEIENMVRESIELAGGLQNIVTNGDYVVLKPNLVEMPPTPTPEYVEVPGMATDWRVTKAVAKMVRELNPDGKIYIIESSAASSTREIFNYYNYTPENFPEVNQIVALEDSSGSFENYTDSKLETILLDDAIRLYPDEQKPNLSPEFYISKIYNNADVVISIPVLKNHKTAIITGGVKNVAIGMTPPNIYGMTETFFGKWTKIDHSFENLHKWLHDFYLCKPVDFVVIDGLQGFDHGPVGIDELTMEEMQHNMRLIIAGKKALSVDAVCGNIMSLDPTYANYMVHLDKEEYNVGTINSKFIRTKGVKIQDVRTVFQHNEEVATNAIYTDYDPPVINVVSSTLDGGVFSFNLDYDNDLDKIELEINGVLIDQVCVDDFNTFSFVIDEDLLPIEEAILIANDRFFNESQISFDNLGLDEPHIEYATINQNYPNPFTNSTTINFNLIKTKIVKLYVSDMNGRLIETLENKELQEGYHQYNWNSNVASGTYLYTIEIDGQRITKQMIKK